MILAGFIADQRTTFCVPRRSSVGRWGCLSRGSTRGVTGVLRLGISTGSLSMLPSMASSMGRRAPMAAHGSWST